MPKFIDLTGQRFERLTVIKQFPTQKGQKTKWECKCDCGNVTVVASTHLRSGHTKSCGCLQKEHAGSLNFKDITNERFGRLIAIENLGSNQKGNALWRCKCDCGNFIVVSGVELRRNHTNSCGCLCSKGEAKIQTILEENNFKFQKEKSFKDCIFPDSLGMARFDFFVNDEYLIEYDGIQHFYSFNFGNERYGEQKFLELQRRDKYKTDWCRKNSIPLIRIPYTIFETLTLEDIALNTTKYRVV